MSIREEMLKEYNLLMEEEIAIHKKRIALKSAISNYKEAKKTLTNKTKKKIEKKCNSVSK